MVWGLLPWGTAARRNSLLLMLTYTLQQHRGGQVDST